MTIRPDKSSTFRSRAIEKLETRYLLAGHGFGEFQLEIDWDFAIEFVGGPIDGKVEHYIRLPRHGEKISCRSSSLKHCGCYVYDENTERCQFVGYDTSQTGTHRRHEAV